MALIKSKYLRLYIQEETGVNLLMLAADPVQVVLSERLGREGALAHLRIDAVASGNRSFDAEEDPFQPFVPQHLTGADPQDRHSLSRKPCLTSLIVAHHRGGIVCEPVHLDRQTGIRTIEIKYVRADRVLPANA